MKKRFKALALAVSAAALTAALPLSALAAQTNDIIEGTFTYMPSFEDAPAQDSFFYSDGYFTESPALDDPHRTSMSMALALSAFEVRGSSYVTDLLTDTGFKDIAIGDMNDIPTDSTIGTAIAHKEVDGHDLVAVAIRGSKYDSEWVGNLKAGKSGDIAGFKDASEKVLERVKDYIDENGLDNVKLWVSGYSRAGAAADLVGAYVNEHPAEFNTTPDDLYVYTFEAPRSSVSNKIYDNIHDYRNKNDIINYVYPEQWGIYANGKPVWIGQDKEIREKWLEVSDGIAVQEGRLKNKEQFIRSLVDYIADNIPRDKFSGDFDTAIQDLIKLYFSKTPEEIEQITEYFKSLQESEGGILSVLEDPEAEYETDSASMLMLLFLTICQHTSDRTYDYVSEGLAEVIERLRVKNQRSEAPLPLSDEDFGTISRTVCDLVRVLGPMAGEEMFFHRTTGSKDNVPEGFFDKDYDPYTDPILFPPESDEGQEYDDPEEDMTDEELGREAGEGAGFAGYYDAVEGREKYASYNDIPDPDDYETELSDEFIAAYKEAYRQSYEEQYELGLADKDDYTISGKGKLQGRSIGNTAGKKDAIAQYGYKASYDETVVHASWDEEELFCDEYDQGYAVGYAEGYEAGYEEGLSAYDDLQMPLYHFVSLIGNFSEIVAEHAPQYNWGLIKTMDSYYTEGVPAAEPAETTTAPVTTTKAAATKAAAKSNSPTTGVSAPAAVFGLFAGLGLVFAARKKED